MAESTAIAWCDHTANFWMGCLKISPGCQLCYAETLTKNRMGLALWGPAATTRRQEVVSVRANLRKWNKLSDPSNPSRVFVGSLMDWAEDHPDADRLRPGIWEAIRQCDRMVFQLLTKRDDRVAALLPDCWDEIRSRVWLGVSIENADYAHRADGIRRLDAAVRFVSYEPALGPLAHDLDLAGINWLIYGGESGPGYRPEDKQWARDMRDKCKAKGVAFFHKQSAAFRTEMGIELDGEVIREYPTPPSRLALPLFQKDE
jgi:protein gp37